MAIGQGELLLTPIQMANISAIIANRGFYFTPHIIKSVEDNEKIDTTFLEKKYTVESETYLNSKKNRVVMRYKKK